ncbi:MAG: hypothetical protein HQL49_05670 [Gammaproteobacteria bacterium]|nr:hypothetical protein [Gammaproteobacteria bacterium]
MKRDTIFASQQTFSAAFAAGLENMVEVQGLGALILLLANASLDAELQQHLQSHLAARFHDASRSYRELLMDGKALPDAEDDILVFLKLVMLGYENLPLASLRRLPEGWELHYNPLRSLRPARSSQQAITCNHAPFNEYGFNFNRQALRRETLWHGYLQGKVVDMLYNKFPFIPYHTLLVPERQHNAPQFLGEGDHYYAWDLAEAVGERLTGIGIGYNSYGAFASVNHLHYQLFMREAPLPIESPQWQHNGGAAAYPSPCDAYSSADCAWEHLESLNRQGKSYNLLYRPGKLYLLPRRAQGDYQHSAWCSGFAWYEMCGGMITYNREVDNQMSDALIRAEFSLLA